MTEVISNPSELEPLMHVIDDTRRVLEGMPNDYMHLRDSSTGSDIEKFHGDSSSLTIVRDFEPDVDIERISAKFRADRGRELTATISRRDYGKGIVDTYYIVRAHGKRRNGEEYTTVGHSSERAKELISKVALNILYEAKNK